MTDMFEKGLAIRKTVLGKEYVEKSLQGADDFTRPLQELVTKYCWGEVWGNGNLSHRDRSLLNLAMLSILNRPHELKLHVKGALTNGVTRDEIREVLLQVASSCSRARTPSRSPEPNVAKNSRVSRSFSLFGCGAVMVLHQPRPRLLWQYASHRFLPALRRK